MAKVAMLLPSSDMVEPAFYAAELYHLDLLSVSVVDMGTMNELVEHTKHTNADLIIARGGHANTIRSITNIPVVEIKVTSMEISIMLEQAKKLSDKIIPFIALTGPENMFADIDIPKFEMLYNIRFKPYLFQHPEEMESTAQAAIRDGADVLIGGHVIYDCCIGQGIPCLRTFSGRESIIETCRIASLISNALDMEKKNASSLKTLLDYTYSGIIHTDDNGNILHVNKFVEHLLGMDACTIERRSIWTFIPKIDEKFLSMVIKKKKVIHSISITIHHTEFIVSAAPVLVDSFATGVIISFHEGRQINAHGEARQKELIHRGYSATSVLDGMVARNAATKELITKAKHYANFQFPILILGEKGTEKQLLAEAIHNAGSMKETPFIRYHCNGHNPEEIKEILFGVGKQADNQLTFHGPCTIFLHEISALSIDLQHQLLILLPPTSALAGTAKQTAVDRNIRFIASSSCPLLPLVKSDMLLPSLYYALNVMTLELPPLRERPEDIMGWMDFHLRKLQETYGRYIKLTKDAQTLLQSYQWSGNLSEMSSLCNRILVDCPNYYIDARMIQPFLESTLPVVAEATPSIQFVDQKAVKLVKLLNKYNGNRSLVAKELSISTATLWRWMNKYNIPKNEGRGSKR